MKLDPIPPEQLRSIRGLPAAKERKAAFPKRSIGTAADARAALKRWEERHPVPKPPVNPKVRIKAVRPSRAAFGKLRAVAESDAAPAEILEQKLDDSKLFGTLYSALTTHEFMKMQAEYKRRKRTGSAAAATEKQWAEIVAAGQAAYAAGGLKVRPADMDRFVTELTASSANLNSVIRIAGSAVPAGQGAALRSAMSLTAAFVPVTDRVIDLAPIVFPIADICDQPLKQGSFTKHFSYSVALSVKITYWCPTWTKPWRTCTKTVTLAGVSFSVGVNVGYKITCCGATAWGQGYAQACATIVAIKVCASCSATILGVAGVSRTPVASGCHYGLGVSAILQCKLGSSTILYLSWPFGWTIAAPCPPAGACA